MSEKEMKTEPTPIEEATHQQPEQQNNDYAAACKQETNATKKQGMLPPPLQQQPQKQQRIPPVSHSNFKVKRKRQHWPKEPTGPNWNSRDDSNVSRTTRRATTTAYTPGTRCGEIFVANNARQWTFVCTYCDKSTRDIGDFICHIKIKHLQQYAASYDEDEDDDEGGQDEENSIRQQMTAEDDEDTYDQDQDYMDFGGYLDVNVHTEEADELTYNGQEQPYIKKQKPLIKQSRTSTRSTTQNKKRNSALESDEIVNLSDGTNDHQDDGPTSSAGSRKSRKHKTAFSPSNGRSSSNEYENFDVNDYTQYDDDEDEEFDNQLFLQHTDDNNSGEGSKTPKRRQIRGTAYCALCNKTFQYYSLYRNHMIKHSNETPFKCPLCKKGFKSKQAIRYHMNTHQRDKRYKCPLCQLGYYTENQFITHVLTHEDPNTFPCMVCGKILRSDKERDIHLTTHTEERPFRCEFCNKLFRLRHHLSNHLKMHRQYRCDYCKNDFTSAVYLRKPYACPECEKKPDVQAHVAANRPRPSSNSVAGDTPVNPLELFESIGLPGAAGDSADMGTDSDEEEDGEGEVEGADGADEEEEDDIYVLPTQQRNAALQMNAKKRHNCKYCHRSYSHISGLNFHIRNKHR